MPDRNGRTGRWEVAIIDVDPKVTTSVWKDACQLDTPAVAFIQPERSPDKMNGGDLGTAFLAAIVECTDDAIIGKDLSGIIKSWNPGAEAIFGHTAAEAIGRPVQILFPPDRLGEEVLIVERIKLGERVEHYETVRRRKDGTDFPVSVTISPIRNACGIIVGASKILRDITERVEGRRALELALEQRTAALSERSLLLREVYHRVKNNLQIVDSLLFTQILGIKDESAKQGLTDLRRRVFAIGLVHERLMSSSDLSTFDIAPFVRDLSDNIMEGTSRELVKFTIDVASLSVGLDFAVPLGLLLTELVTNSLKHALADGAGEISVVLRPEGGANVVLTVSDNGKHQVKTAAEPTRRGVGMELVKSLVGQLQGKIETQTHAGQTTRISIPLAVLS